MAGSPTIAGLFTQTQRMVVGVAEYAVASRSPITLSTYALGSCVGIVVYDPLVQAGGLLHIMLPDSTLSPDKAAAQPAMFADTGIPVMFGALSGLGCMRGRMRIFLAGGASVLSGPDSFKIGERNIVAVRNILRTYGCSIAGEQVGGFVNRTVHLEVHTGNLTLKSPERTMQCRLG